MTGKGQTFVDSYHTLHVNFLVSDHVCFAIWQPQKKVLCPVVVKQVMSLKYVKDFYCVDQLCFVPNVMNALVVAPDLHVWARLHQFWETWAALLAGPNVITVLRLLHSPLPDLAKFDNVTDHPKSLCTSPEELLPDRGITCVCARECSRTGQNSEISRFLQQTFLGAKTQQLVETLLGPQYSEQI